jgi:hypothetical protein
MGERADLPGSGIRKNGCHREGGARDDPLKTVENRCEGVQPRSDTILTPQPSLTAPFRHERESLSTCPRSGIRKNGFHREGAARDDPLKTVENRF